MHRWSQRLPGRVVISAVLVLSALGSLVPMVARASGFQQTYIRLDRMKANTLTGGTVCAQPSGAAPTEAKVKVTFPVNYVLASFGSWTVNTTDIPVGSTAWTGITVSGGGISGQTITFGSGDLASASTLYCFNFSASVTTDPSASNSQQAVVETTTSAPASIDLTQVALATVADDQIQVSAVVPPSFLFTLGGTTDTFGNLSPASVSSTSGVTVSVTTNAKGGWIAWAKDQYQGLHSATAGYTIPTVGTLSSGSFANGVTDGSTSTLTPATEGYVLDTDLTNDATGGCTLGIASEYDGNTATKGGSVMGNFQQIAACTGASPATANGDIITLVERAAISGATPAASDYGDVITVVGAGNF